jgi:hypothetical protein
MQWEDMNWSYVAQECLMVGFHEHDNERKICGFHGGDYEECRLLRYKNPLRTPQETHYVSAT